VPAQALAFFAEWLTPAQVVWWFAVTDGLVRTAVVVIMWLVTGMVWRGVATMQVASAGNAAEIARMQQDLTEAHEAVTLAREALAAARHFEALPQQLRVKWIVANRNGEGPTNAEIARNEGVHPSQIGRWSKAQ